MTAPAAALPPPKRLASLAATLPQRSGLVLAALALWLLATIGWRPLILPDEGRYVGVAWQMLVGGGDGWLPTLNGLPYFHKPPLMYWLDMAALALLGPQPFAGRLAPAVGGWLMGAALFLLVRRRHGAPTAALALAVLATSPFFFVGAQFANHDMLVAGLITVTLACLHRALEDPAQTARRWVVAAWAAAALAVLAKGLIGVVLPGLVVLPLLLVQRRWRALAALLHPAGLLVFVALAAPWFWVMQQRFPQFLDYFFVEQHFRRYAQGGFNNRQPFWFFFAALPLLTLPWSLWLPRALRDAWQGWRAGRGLPADWPWFAGWVAAVLLFFSLPQSKLVGYVLPALAPWAALCTLAVARGRAWRWLLPLAALANVAIVGALALAVPNSHRDLGQALAQRLAPGDRVVFVGEPFFDLPFYARLRHSAIVLEDWDDPRIPQRDDWRKELLDAARFDPARGAQLLVHTRELPRLLCAPGRLWFVVGRGDGRPPPLAALSEVFIGARGALLLAEGGAAATCP